MEINESIQKKIDDLAQELMDNNIPFIIETNTRITIEMLTHPKKQGIETGDGLCAMAMNGNGVEITSMISRAIIEFCRVTGAPYELALNTVDRVVREIMGAENRDDEAAVRENIIRKGVEDFIQDMKKKFRDAGIDADFNQRW